MSRPVPPPPKNMFREDSSSDENEAVDPGNSNIFHRRRENNQIEAPSENENDEVFHPAAEDVETVEVIKTDNDKVEEPAAIPNLRNRRVSYGRIPVPPMAVTVADIQEAAKQSREENGKEEVEVRKPVDTRRSSVSLDVFKGFRDPHDKKNMPAKDKTIYVEGPNGKFREMKKGRFWDKDKFESPIIIKPKKKEKESIIPYLLKAPGQAFRTQRVYNQLANIIQGFLAGITVMLAIFSFNLDAYVLVGGYRLMSLPIHAAFMVAFTVGLVSAIDRTGIYEVEHFTSRTRLTATIHNNGLFTVIVWFCGLISTLLCIQLESQLAFAPTRIPADSLIYKWRIFNVLRALTAALGFLLLAFKPDSDTMAKELRTAIFDQLELVTTDPDRQKIILTAMKI
ncbi:hypothetical protein GCK72_025251 [Caenorhabditis remanei]|uniref:Uncharacterized protein n=1 Tax=Caenorhabditis remanei TaxID=31234 RepID=A0A6A5G2E2_CAERE|nr:hypothetical protein GCK72_025251 [Caenorhabditis remanei]KAF1748784.1 hypothetical protein GCK72_025251 [Caenorhabditis remanei]